MGCTVGKDVIVGSWIGRGARRPSPSSRGLFLLGGSSSSRDSVMGSQRTFRGRSRASASVDEERMVAGKNLRGVAVKEEGWGREGLAGREWEEEEI